MELKSNSVFRSGFILDEEHTQKILRMASGYGMEAHEIILYAIETAYEAFEYWETNCE